jgi:hypothetical protein
MRIMVDVVRRERARGRQHPDWLQWAGSYADWLVTQQREDGSFPESWQGGTGRVKGTSGVTTYAAVPVLVRMTGETGEQKYVDAAVRAADYVWANFGSKCVYLGATGGGVADKESGMLSLEAFLALYEYTKDDHYLDVARVLLHGTKAMLALPGRTYDLLGPGWQQEHWRMGPGVRGIGAHRTWLPWVSVNHPHGITGLEELDTSLYQRLAHRR